MRSAATLIATTFIVALALPSYAQDKAAQPQAKTGEPKASRADAKGIRELAEANMAEVATGKVALQKAQNPEVKKFAQHMVDDHGKMLQEVQQLAQSKGVDMPKEPKRKHKSAMSKLEKASGDQFDKEYMSLMVKDHSDTVKNVEKIARNAKDAEVKSAAQKALPDIKEHLQMAQQLAGKGGASSRGASGEKGSASNSGSGR